MTPSNEVREPLMFCLCGPGASGKSTISRRLLADNQASGSTISLQLSVSTTTRSPRASEQQGRDYHFVSEEEFESRVQAGLFLEYAQFNGRRYGTEFQNLHSCRERGRDLLLDIDVQGAQTLRDRFGSNVIVILVFPPSGALLVERFRSRGEDSPEKIASRLEIARAEVAHLRDPDLTDYLVINDDLDRAVRRTRAVIDAEQIRLERFSVRFLDSLLVIPPDTKAHKS